MRTDQARVPLIPEDRWTENVRNVMRPFQEQGRNSNIMKVLANHPDFVDRWVPLARHIVGASTLEGRDRELLILRTGYLCDAEYEWGHHVAIAREIGVDDSEIESCKTGSQTENLSDFDRLLFRAAEELHDDAFVTDDTWNGLADYLSVQQLMDVVVTVGGYTLVAMAMNTFGTPLDEGVPGWEL